MRAELLLLALGVGAANWAFRALPLRFNLHELPPGAPLARFLAATGPAAIGTLFVASLLPMVAGQGALPPLALGVGATVAAFALRRSVVLATLAGAFAYGLATWALGAV